MYNVSKERQREREGMSSYSTVSLTLKSEWKTMSTGCWLVSQFTGTHAHHNAPEYKVQCVCLSIENYMYMYIQWNL